MNNPMNNFMQYQNIRESGLPPGRRYHGYGISPAGPGGPHPAHQMNFMGPMANLGMNQHPFGAGRYPYPQHPMPFQGVGGGHAGMSPFVGGQAGPGLPGMNPMAQMVGGGMMNPMAAMGAMNAMNAMNPMMTYMSPQLLELLGGGMNQYDDDDTGVWDGDDEDADGIIQPRRGNRRVRRRRAGLPPFGPAMGMNPMGMAGMPVMGMPGMPMGMPGMPMGMPMGMPVM